MFQSFCLSTSLSSVFSFSLYDTGFLSVHVSKFCLSFSLNMFQSFFLSTSLSSVFSFSLYDSGFLSVHVSKFCLFFLSL